MLHKVCALILDRAFIRRGLTYGKFSGIGREIATRLAHDGYKVVLADLPSQQSALDEAAKAIKLDSGSEASTFPVDVTNEEQVKELVKTTVERYGGLDVVSLPAFLPVYAITKSQKPIPYRWYRMLGSRKWSLCWIVSA